MSAIGKKKNRVYTLKLTEVLGKGTTGSVVVATDESGNRVACKIIEKPGRFKTDLWELIWTEIDTLTRLPKHKHLPEIYSLSEDSDNFYIFMELIEGETLWEVVDKKGSLSGDEAKIYFKQIIDAVEVCHTNNIVHRDIKLENIMVTKEGIVKLIDFGFSDYLFEKTPEKKIVHEKFCGSLHYAPPELIKRNRYYADCVDIWCAGITLFCLIEKRLPFFGKSKNDIYTNILNQDVTFKKDQEKELINIVKWMLSKNWSERPSIEQIKNCSWLS